MPKLFFFLALSLSACSMKSIALRSTTDLLQQGSTAFYEEEDPAFAESALISHLKLLEVLIKNDPHHPKLNGLAAQGFGAYAFLFLEDQDLERAKTFYQRGRNFGLGALKNKYKIDLLKETDLTSLDRHLQKISKKDIPLLFWTAYCWGGFIHLSRDHPEALVSLPKIEKIMTFVSAVAPHYFYGGADVFLGSYYGSRPKILGGDLEKAKQYFERALKTSEGKFLMSGLLYAQYYAIPAQDKTLFLDLLKRTLAFSTDSFLEQRLSNLIAQKRAQKLFDTMDEYFYE
jgi:hypothetical protein